jgi:thiosulfate/3-mercaptopyruvate sulfurtransferase
MMSQAFLTIDERGYASTDVLVSTAWVAEHVDHPGVRIVEVDVDTMSYEQGHVPLAITWNWTTDLCDTMVRDIVPRAALESLLGRSGIDNSTTIVLYGDNNNWFAAWAFWQLKVYGHDDVRIMDGGRRKWLAEERELTLETPSPVHRVYKAKDPDRSLRALLPDVMAVLGKGVPLVDVRSPQEFSGEILAPPGLPETCQRGGHIPGAANIPWAKACNDDGTFRSADELRALYGDLGVTSDREVITYCRIGERSSPSWFVLKYLLGYPRVRNSAASRPERRNLAGAPDHRGTRGPRPRRSEPTTSRAGASATPRTASVRSTTRPSRTPRSARALHAAVA